MPRITTCHDRTAGIHRYAMVTRRVNRWCLTGIELVCLPDRDLYIAQRFDDDVRNSRSARFIFYGATYLRVTPDAWTAIDGQGEPDPAFLHGLDLAEAIALDALVARARRRRRLRPPQ